MSTKLESRLHRKPGAEKHGPHSDRPDRKMGWLPYPATGDGKKPTWAVAATIVALVVLAVALGLFLNNDDNTASGAPLELSAGGDAFASCMAFDVQTLAGMSTAFAGTVTQIQSGAITLDVDRWYTGGDASTVRLTTIDNAEALLGGIPFEVGSQYLLTASDGALNYCGYSGPATPEFQNSFNTAFPG